MLRKCKLCTVETFAEFCILTYPKCLDQYLHIAGIECMFAGMPEPSVSPGS